RVEQRPSTITPHPIYPELSGCGRGRDEPKPQLLNEDPFPASKQGTFRKVLTRETNLARVTRGARSTVGGDVLDQVQHQPYRYAGAALGQVAVRFARVVRGAGDVDMRPRQALGHELAEKGAALEHVAGPVHPGVDL